MIRVAYRSTAVRPDLALLALAEIISVSDHNNRGDHVTGALLVSQGRFFQVLEGAEPDVDRALKRIAADSRHRDIRVVLRRAASERLFAEWSMVAARVSPSAAPAIDAAIDQCEHHPEAAVDAMVELVRHQQGRHGP